MTDALEGLRPKLDNLDEVRLPDQPIEVYFQETEDLLTHVEANGLRGVLIDEGLDESVFDEIVTSLAAARQAQTEWTLLNDREKPESQKVMEAKGYALRTKAAKKARFTLRKDRSALAIIGDILEGEGLADLVQDLDDLSKLIADRPEAFARNRNFDSAATVAEMKATANSIRSGLSGFRMNPTQAKAVELRNRAWTHLDALVGDLREAGRAATEGTIARGFGSAYNRRLAAEARRRKAEKKGSDVG